MAEHPEKDPYDRAETHGGWHTQFPTGWIDGSTFGQISYSQSRQISAENHSSREQDAFDSSISKNPNLPLPMHFRHPTLWSQNSPSRRYDLLSADSHVGLGSDIEQTKLEASYGAAKNSYTKDFRHEPGLGQIEPSSFDLSSPTFGLCPL